jgi:hypothetical protein
VARSPPGPFEARIGGQIDEMDTGPHEQQQAVVDGTCSVRYRARRRLRGGC